MRTSRSKQTFFSAFLFTETCPKCEHPRAYFMQIQTRSADEPMTTFYKCCNAQCGHRWRDWNLCTLRVYCIQCSCRVYFFLKISLYLLLRVSGNSRISWFTIDAVPVSVHFFSSLQIFTSNIHFPHTIKTSLTENHHVQIFIDKIVPVYNSPTKFDLHSYTYHRQCRSVLSTTTAYSTSY